MEASENLRINQPVAEYTGRVMLREEFEATQPASYVTTFSHVMLECVRYLSDLSVRLLCYLQQV